MNYRHYDWVCGGNLSVLQRHDEVKRALLLDYLDDYFMTIVPNPNNKVMGEQ